jgi:hypothetical protein
MSANHFSPKTSLHLQYAHMADYKRSRIRFLELLSRLGRTEKNADNQKKHLTLLMGKFLSVVEGLSSKSPRMGNKLLLCIPYYFLLFLNFSILTYINPKALPLSPRSLSPIFLQFRISPVKPFVFVDKYGRTKAANASHSWAWGALRRSSCSIRYR